MNDSLNQSRRKCTIIDVTGYASVIQLIDTKLVFVLKHVFTPSSN